MKVAIVGAGGVGGYFGGLLARAGHDVTYIARGAHLDAIARNGGLRVVSQNDGDFFAPGRGVGDTADAGVQDLILFTVKMQHNAAAVTSLPPMVGPGHRGPHPSERHRQRRADGCRRRPGAGDDWLGLYGGAAFPSRAS